MKPAAVILIFAFLGLVAIAIVQSNTYLRNLIKQSPLASTNPSVFPSASLSAISPSPAASASKQTGGCKRAGCSSELCVDENSEGIITDCAYKVEYACYSNAKCERQSDGQCGFTITEQIQACLNNVQTRPFSPVVN